MFSAARKTYFLRVNKVETTKPKHCLGRSLQLCTWSVTVNETLKAGFHPFKSSQSPRDAHFCHTDQISNQAIKKTNKTNENTNNSTDNTALTTLCKGWSSTRSGLFRVTKSFGTHTCLQKIRCRSCISGAPLLGVTALVSPLLLIIALKGPKFFVLLSQALFLGLGHLAAGLERLADGLGLGLGKFQKHRPFALL